MQIMINFKKKYIYIGVVYFGFLGILCEFFFYFHDAFNMKGGQTWRQQSRNSSLVVKSVRRLRAVLWPAHHLSHPPVVVLVGR